MKKVILDDIESATIRLPEVTTNHFIGVEKKIGGGRALQKGFITQQNYKRGKFICRALVGLTYGNGWDSWDNESLHELLKGFIERDQFTVRIFNTSRELLEWLLTDNSDLSN